MRKGSKEAKAWGRKMKRLRSKPKTKRRRVSIGVKNPHYIVGATVDSMCRHETKIIWDAIHSPRRSYWFKKAE